MGWELRFFFVDSPDDFNATRVKMFDVLNLPQELLPSQLEKRTDSYLQLNSPELGFKFRGALKNDTGSLEYKLRTKGESPNAENWVKRQSGCVSLADREKLIEVVSSTDSIPFSLDEKLQDFDVQRDVIHCDKERFNRIISSSNIQHVVLDSAGVTVPSFNGIGFEYAKFNLRRNSGEKLGQYCSFNFEGSTQEKLGQLGAAVTSYLGYQGTVYCMGYPEFIMKVSNGEIR